MNLFSNLSTSLSRSLFLHKIRPTLHNLIDYRYIAVCAPFFRLRNRIKASYYILPIVLFAPLYNIPRFFELESTKETRYFCEEEANETDVVIGITKVIVELDEHQYDNLINGNSSMLVFNCTNSTKNTLTATDFRKDPLYVKVRTMHALCISLQSNKYPIPYYT